MTFYIDIYFLVNFSVDVLALYFATYLSKVPSSNIRLVTAAAIGAAVAVAEFFASEMLLMSLLISVAGLLVIGSVGVSGVGLRRRLKFVIAFVIFCAVFGGMAHLLWSLFDTIIAGKITYSGNEVNRKLLILSVITLISLGVFKMFVALFSSNGTERSVKITIRFLDKCVSTEALIDTGNLAIDPMDMRPVMMIKARLAKMVFPDGVVELADPDSLEREVRKRIRLIPVSMGGVTHVLTGIRTDGVIAVTDNGEEKIEVTVAIDREGGDYGGYDALMPAAAIEDAFIK